MKSKTQTEPKVLLKITQPTNPKLIVVEITTQEDGVNIYTEHSSNPMQRGTKKDGWQKVSYTHLPHRTMLQLIEAYKREKDNEK